MDPVKSIVLTDLALRAARDCPSRKPVKRLKAAFNAVLDADPQCDEETLLMSAIGGLLRVVDDRTGVAIQRELYGLGRISSLIQATPEGEAPDEAEMAKIDADMPPESDRLKILAVWEMCRASCGLFRPNENLLTPEELGAGQPDRDVEEWKVDEDLHGEES